MSFILYNCSQWNCIQNKTSLSIGILIKSVLITRLFNNPFASCFLINFDFLSPHTAHFGNIIIPPFIAFEICRKICSFLYFLHTLDNKMALFLYTIFSSFLQRSCTQLHLTELHLKKKRYLLILEFYLKVF